MDRGGRIFFFFWKVYVVPFFGRDFLARDFYEICKVIEIC